MKLIYNSSMAWLCVVMLTISNLYAQNQRIPFQGTLYQSGTAVNGTVNITFTIDDPAWTETHENVNVTQGVYAVVLGESTAFPEDMFTKGTVPQLAISIGGTEVADVPLYAPFISEHIVSKNMPDSLNKEFEEVTASEHNTLVVTVSGVGAGDNAAIEAMAQTSGSNSAVQGFSMSDDGNVGAQYGMFGASFGTGTNTHHGVAGSADGQGKYNKGLYGTASGAGNGDTGQDYGEGSINFGVEGNATGNAWNNTGVEGSNYGTEGEWNFGVHGISNAGTGDAVENHGVAGRAFGPGVNYGVFGQANNGDVNYAGFFEGDVNINGELMVNGSPINLASDSLIEVRNPDGDVRAEMSYFDQNDAGSVLLYGANDSTKAILGTSGGGYAGGLWLYDSLRFLGAQLRVTNKGRGTLYTNNENHQNVGWFGGYGNDGFVQLVTYDDAEEVTGAALIGAFADGSNPEFYLEGVKQEYLGLARLRVEQVGSEESARLELNTSNNGASFSVGIVNDDGGNDTDGYSSEMYLNGTNTPNFQIGGQSWENNDLANFNMYGRTETGDGWYHSNINLSVGSDGTDDWGGLSITRSNIAGNTNTETFNVNGQNGNGMFAGAVSMANNRVNLGTFSWEGNGGSDRGVIFLDGTDDAGISDRGRASMEVRNDGSGSFGFLLLRNYTDGGGGSPSESIALNGENGDIKAGTLNLNKGDGDFVGIGSKDWEGNDGDKRGRIHLMGTDDGLSSGDNQRVYLEVDNYGSGSFGVLGLKNYVDDGGGNGTTTIGLNGENGDGYFQGEVFANSIGSPRVSFHSTWGNNGQGALHIRDANDNDRITASVDDDGSGNYWGNIHLNNSTDGNHVNIDGNGYINSNGSDDSRVGIEPGGINLGASNPYDNGIVMNYNGTNGGIYEMYSGSALQVFMNGSNGDASFQGNVWASTFESPNALNVTSDQRFKKNVKSIDGALAKTQQLNGYTYNWNKLAEKQKGITSKEEQVGVLAQELEAVFPQLVKTDNEGFKSVNYAALTAVLIEAVKELSEQVGTLQGENEELKAELTKVDELEIKIDLIQKLLAKQTLEASKATVSR